MACWGLGLLNHVWRQPADIPGVPMALGLCVILIAVQPLLNHEPVWIPQWMEKRELSSRRVKKLPWPDVTAFGLALLAKVRTSGV